MVDQYVASDIAKIKKIFSKPSNESPKKPIKKKSSYFSVEIPKEGIPKESYAIRSRREQLEKEKREKITKDKKRKEDLAKKEKEAKIAKEKRDKQMDIWFSNKNNIKKIALIVGGFIGIILFWVLPSTYRILSFIVPALSMSYAFSKEGINFPLLLLFGVIFLLFPTSYFSLDITQSYYTKIWRIESFANNIINVTTGVVFIAIPILMIISAVWSIYQGDVEKGVSAITKVVVMVIVILVFIFFANTFSVPLVGYLAPIGTISEFVFSTISWINDSFSGLMNGIDFFDVFPDIPQTPSLPTMLDALSDPSNLRLSIVSSFPLTLSVISIGLGIISYLFNKRLVGIKFDTTNPISRPNAFNYEFLIYMVFVLISYFAFFLWLGEGAFLNYRNVGFFTIYLTTIVVCLLALSFGLGSVSKNKPNTFLGILYGLSALYIVFNLFQQEATLSLVEFEYSSQIDITIYNIIAQFLCVANSESFLYHVFIPALAMNIILRRNKGFNDKKIDEEISQKRAEIQNLNLQNSYFQVALLKPKLLEKSKLSKKIDFGDTIDFVGNIERISKLNNDIFKLDEMKKKEYTIGSSDITSKQKVVFWIVVVLSNLIFSMMHWFNSNMDLRLFWASGLGLVYFLSGIILTIVSYRYGWLSGIICHAINNSQYFILILVMGGII